MPMPRGNRRTALVVPAEDVDKVGILCEHGREPFAVAMIPTHFHVFHYFTNGLLVVVHSHSSVGLSVSSLQTAAFT
jgi:hypothetical protein